MSGRQFGFDAQMSLYSGPAVTSSGALHNGGLTPFTGPSRFKAVGNSAFEARLLVIVDAIEMGSSDERYDLSVHGCDDPAFGSGIEVLGVISFGATGARPGGAVDTVPGRYEIEIVNVQRGAVFP
jgi:hypothetical protein